MDLVLFGIQGSGKGTQARKIAAEFGYDIFETGAELRRLIASGSDLGKTAASYMDKGNLVPLSLVMQVTKEAMIAKAKTQKMLFDGIPRDREQMRAFDALMEEVGRPFRSLHIRLSDEEALQRILGRAKVEGRVDDSDEEYIRRRMEIFREKTLPVIDEYRRQGKLIDVDGRGTIEEVYGRVKEAMEAEWTC
ncbi:adenylate kinase [Candidatus Peregrinibacteria bacterium]|nr:adenylate kinase [Candidatus Peregrinibacteria bacterium]